MSARVQRTVTPIDGSVYAERPLASDENIDKVLARAVEAQKEWRKVPVNERAAICTRMASWCVNRADVLADELTRQMGRPIAHTPGEIRRGFQERVAYLSSAAPATLADVAIAPQQNFQRFIRREPHGVVLVIAPWNYPWLTSVNAVVPALLAGNAVILKMAQQTPLVAERYAEAFKAARLPDGVFHFLHLDHDQVARTIGDRRVGFVAFTGSVNAGYAIQQAASDRFIASGLELGGKDPAYVRSDAPLDATIENLVDGAFFNAGQSCCAVERIYVQRNVYDDFVAGFVELTKKYRLGNPLDPETTLGPMVRTQAAEDVRAQVREAVSKGAKPLIPTSSFSQDKERTPYLAPQVLVNVSHEMQIMREETFGPAIGIMPVEDDDEAIALMNDSHYGLTASVWTADLDAAVRIGERIETGTCYMNRCDYLDPALAWTGVKDSGRGVSLSRLGIEAFTRPKSFHLRLKM